MAVDHGISIIQHRICHCQWCRMQGVSIICRRHRHRNQDHRWPVLCEEFLSPDLFHPSFWKGFYIYNPIIAYRNLKSIGIVLGGNCKAFIVQFRMMPFKLLIHTEGTRLHN